MSEPLPDLDDTVAFYRWAEKICIRLEMAAYDKDGNEISLLSDEEKALIDAHYQRSVGAAR